MHRSLVFADVAHGLCCNVLDAAVPDPCNAHRPWHLQAVMGNDDAKIMGEGSLPSDLL